MAVRGFDCLNVYLRPKCQYRKPTSSSACSLYQSKRDNSWLRFIGSMSLDILLFPLSTGSASVDVVPVRVAIAFREVKFS